MPIHLSQYRHYRSLLNGDLRLKRFEDDDSDKFLSVLHQHIK